MAFFNFLCLPFLLMNLPIVVPEAGSLTTIARENYLAYYSKHCNGVVPEAPVTDTLSDVDSGISGKGDTILHFETAHVAGGRGLLPFSPYADPNWEPPGTQFSFQPFRNSFFVTKADDVFRLRASLRFSAGWLPLEGRNLKQLRYRPPKIPIRSSSRTFELYGFWSRSNGKLCMVGSGSSPSNPGGLSHFTALLKLNFPVNFSDYRSLITGELVSLNESVDSRQFEPVSILGLPHAGDYKYTLINDTNDIYCVNSSVKEENLHLNLTGPNSCISEVLRFAKFYKLQYGRECNPKFSGDRRKCNPLGENSDNIPRFMALKGIRCDNSHAIRVMVIFSRLPHYPFGILQRAFDPSTMLVGEAAWSEEKEVLCIVACRVSNFSGSFSNAFIGDCSSQLDLRVPTLLNIKSRNTVEGRITSKKSANETGYFHEILFHGFQMRLTGLGLRYKYTQLEKVSGSCPIKRGSRKRGSMYPHSQSKEMMFGISAKNDKGQVTLMGHFTPLFVNYQMYEPLQKSFFQNGLVNVSYTIIFFPSGNSKLRNFFSSNESVEISSEGTYDSVTGALCMVGCRHIENSMSSTDCEITINVQFSPLNGNGNIKGTIKSKRPKSDPLFFDQLTLSSSSMYASQATKSVWRMDMEITMALISNTLACLFLGLQLHHIKKHPDTLPFISFTMLAVLTAGYMLPLLLNFEAVFAGNPNRHDVLLGNDGWLEVNEVTIRVVTMVAFLLQIRIVQLAWCARTSSEMRRHLWRSEIRVAYTMLPLYIGGFFLSQKWKKMSNPTAWGPLKSYAGLIMDVFLLPQIAFNVFATSEGSVLAAAFYVGASCVRVFPHAYDLYRARMSPWARSWSYIYANHKQDFFSTAWDVGISLSAVLLCVITYFQQKRGGRCIIPHKFIAVNEYEKVPAISMEERHPVIS